MKTLIFLLLFVCTLFSCQKENVETSTTATNTSTNTTSTTTTSNQTLLLQGNFTNGDHPTSGVAKVYEDKDKKRTLVFENFKTDAGPDLRIYLADNKSANNFIQVADKVQNGNLELSIPSSVDLTKQMHVLIWCKKFSVLFGSAQLK